MPINFSNLVLAPCFDTFGVNVTIDPIASRPGDPPYRARVIYTTKHLDVQSIDGAILSDQLTVLGFRFDDFEGPTPIALDVITVDDNAMLAHGVPPGRYIIDDVNIDGQGGVVIGFHKVEPDYPR